MSRPQDKDKLTYRILSGTTRIKINNELFLIKSADVSQKYVAEELYHDLVEQYLFDGLLTEAELMSWMVKEKFWSDEEEETIGAMKKNIEEFQVKLFELGLKGNELATTKKAIEHSRATIRTLMEKKHHYDYLCATGQALIEKNKFLIGMGICDRRGERLLNDFTFNQCTFPLFDKIIIEYNAASISISDYRLIARSEPWRQYWTAKETVSGIFRSNGIDLTDEQLTLISWTKLYDSVFQHPKCPPDEVIDDDDILDGFLIKDKREREKERAKSLIDQAITNDRIKNSEEVYIVPDAKPELGLTVEKIYDMNSEDVKSVIKARNKLVDERGKVAQYHLPDVKLKLQMQLNKDSMKKE